MESHPASPRLSIICPIWNVREYIEQTLQSVEDQTFQDWELLLMDGASTDGAQEIIGTYIAKDPRISLHSEKDEGPWDATDKGIDRARGEFIAIIGGQDGFLDKEWLAKCMAVFDKDKTVSLVWGSTREMDEKGNLGGEYHVAYSHLLRKESPLDSLKNVFWKAGHFTKDLATANKTRKKIIIKKLFSKTAGMRLAFLTSRSFPNGEPPQKQALLPYWLKTGFLFPDQAMCLTKKAYLDCAPRYPKGSRMVNHLTDFNFNFNSRGYLSYYIPTLAMFGRVHPGNSGDRVPEELYGEHEKYLKRILDLRKKIAKGSTITFIDREGHPVATT